MQRALADLPQAELVGVIRVQGLQLGHLGEPALGQRGPLRVVFGPGLILLGPVPAAAAVAALGLQEVSQPQPQPLLVIVLQILEPHGLTLVIH
ncbi:hypothetical protein [Streptomyces sanglieri]|uniref:hypothetical protein n=1 Tax=Streptomyces sanglieri TaxID=193460 RepID=UPI003523C336